MSRKGSVETKLDSARDAGFLQKRGRAQDSIRLFGVHRSTRRLLVTRRSILSVCRSDAKAFVRSGPARRRTARLRMRRAKLDGERQGCQ
jgi:hypothetical protein